MSSLNIVKSADVVNLRRGKMGLRERRERAKHQLRQEILDAARDLFVQEGYANVSMRRIADRIEYSPTTIYLYFRDKADLFYNVCEETFSILADRMEKIRTEHHDPIEALKRGCRAYVDFGIAYPNHYRVTFMTHHNDAQAADYLRKDSMGMKAFGYLVSSVEECVRSGRFKSNDVQMVSQMLWAAGHGLTSLLITKPDFPWADKNALIDTTIDILIDGLMTDDRDLLGNI